MYQSTKKPQTASVLNVQNVNKFGLHDNMTRHSDRKPSTSHSFRPYTDLTTFNSGEPSSSTISSDKAQIEQLYLQNTEPICTSSKVPYKPASSNMKQSLPLCTKNKNNATHCVTVDSFMMERNIIEPLLKCLEPITDFASCRQCLYTAVSKPTTLLSQLTSMIENCGDLDICCCAIKILHKIITQANKEKSYLDDDIFVNYKNVNNLIDALPKLESTFGHYRTYKQCHEDWQIKILQSASIMSTKSHWKNKLKYLTSDTVRYLGGRLARKSDNRELVNQLLNIIKIVCIQQYNCRCISNQEFYDGLSYAFNLTHRIVTITDIFELLMYKRSIIRYLQGNEDVISLFIQMILYRTAKYTVTKKKIICMLYKVALDSGKALKLLDTEDYFLKLLSYCTSKGELNCYNSQLKIYSLLNRSLKPAVLLDERLHSGLTLPPHLIPSANESNIFIEDDSDSDDKSCSSETNLKTNFNVQRDVDDPIPDMSRFYTEIFEQQESCVKDNYHVKTKSFRYFKIDYHAYPDAIMMEPQSYDEFITPQKCDSFTNSLTQRIRQLHDNVQPIFTPKVVYDLDMLYKASAPLQIIHPRDFLQPNDVPPNIDDKLLFESRFESGNLRKAIQVEEYEYELLLSPDTCTSHGFQWYYFEVANMQINVPYTFRIINFTKTKSSYTDGMKPLMFSILAHQLHNIGWKRITGDVHYYSNHYVTLNGEAKFYTLSFTVTFQYPSDYVYFAYHYPYTYTRLMLMLSEMSKFDSKRILIRVDKLTNTINNFNHVPVVTITSKSLDQQKCEIPINKRPIVFLTGRVHPGESNSSWIMEGILRFLLNESDANAILARKYYIFKIVPMLNPEGVIYGNTRTGLNGIDLNRCWSKPSHILYPEIYFAKQLVGYAKCEMVHPVSSFIDIHGHSKKKFFFLFGCNPKLSWNYKDKLKGNRSHLLKIIPNAINLTNPNIQLDLCQNCISKRKESTARIVIWRNYNIVHSYTLECSHSELLHRISVSTSLLANIGSSLITAFAKIAKSAQNKYEAIPSLCLDYSETGTLSIKQ